MIDARQALTRWINGVNADRLRRGIAAIDSPVGMERWLAAVCQLRCVRQLAAVARLVCLSDDAPPEVIADLVEEQAFDTSKL